MNPRCVGFLMSRWCCRADLTRWFGGSSRQTQTWISRTASRPSAWWASFIRRLGTIQFGLVGGFKHFWLPPRLTTGGDIPSPSGKRNLHSELENHHLSWENQRTQWPFSIAMLNYQRVQFGDFKSGYYLQTWDFWWEYMSRWNGMEISWEQSP